MYGSGGPLCEALMLAARCLVASRFSVRGHSEAPTETRGSFSPGRDTENHIIVRFALVLLIMMRQFGYTRRLTWLFPWVDPWSSVPIPTPNRRGIPITPKLQIASSSNRYGTKPCCQSLWVPRWLLILMARKEPWVTRSGGVEVDRTKLVQV